jgi:hypothetical protein
MDTYTLFTKADGWIETNTRTFVNFFLAKEGASKLARGNRLRMLTGVHDNLPPSEYPCTRALSAHSAVIQLYARSGQLPTAETLESRSRLECCLCRWGCNAVESMHHIFVGCAQFDEWRRNAGAEVSLRTERKLEEVEMREEDRQPILNSAKSLFIDDPAVWPSISRLAYERDSASRKNFRECPTDHGCARSGRITSSLYPAPPWSSLFPLAAFFPPGFRARRFFK